MTSASGHLWTSDAVLRATGGVSPSRWNADGVSIDSRTISSGDLFVAIQGPNQDGHLYVENAFEKGAAAALVHRKLDGVSGPCIEVGDTLAGLNSLGRTARARTAARVVAVTGSVGKTSTKDALRVALSASGRTHASAASYNNMWGVPLSLARMPENAQFGVFEVGMNHPGEINPLVHLVAPHVAIVTTVQPVHIEFFDSVDDIADEKAEIFSAFENGGSAIINADMVHFDRVRQHAERYGASKILGFGETQEAQARLISVATRDSSSDVEADILGQVVRYRIAMPGRHFVLNSLAVLAAVKELGGDVEAGAHALAGLTPGAGRGARHEINLDGKRILLVDESYNANPSSVAAALAVLSETYLEREGRRIAVLGDMLELGNEADSYHGDLISSILNTNIDRVFLCGRHMTALWDLIPDQLRGKFAEDAEALITPLCDELATGDVVMVKGSLGSQMGKIVQHLLAQDAQKETTGRG